MKFSIISVISGVSGDSGESTWPEKLRIDEKMVPFKGKSGLKQYNLQKPNKWGYQLYVLSGIDRLIHNFEVHIGAIGVCPNQPDLKASEVQC